MGQYIYSVIALCTFYTLTLGAYSLAEAKNPHHRWANELSAAQKEKIEHIIQEAEPKITSMQLELQEKIHKLKNFTYTGPEDHEYLSALGRELQNQRQALRKELRALDKRILQEVGVSLHGYRGRDCNSLSQQSPSKENNLIEQELNTTHHKE